MSFPELAAQRVITALKISCIEDLHLTNEIAFERGALVIEDRLTGAEARLIISYPRSFITVSTNVIDMNRRRFGATHELGHLEMHRGKQSFFNCSKDDLDSGGIKKISSPTMENEANEFAANLLMPKQFFAPLCESAEINFSALGELASKFRVSLTAAALRFIDVSKEPLAVVVSSNGVIRWFDANKDFSNLDLFVDVGSRLHRETQAVKAFQGSSLPAQPRQVPIHAWMRPGHYSPRAKLSEQSISMSSYNSVLSLLWINEVIDDDLD